MDKQKALSFLKERGTNFPKRPKLVEDILVFSMPDGLGIQFRGLSSPVVLRGALVEELLPELLPLLNGQHEISQLFEKCGAEFEPADVAVLLLSLFTRGAIVEAGAEGSPHVIVDRKSLLFHGRRLGVTRNNNSSSEVLKKLSCAHIVVIADGLLGASTIDMLSRSGFDKITAAALKTRTDAAEIFGELQSEFNVKNIDGNENGIRSFLQGCLESADLVVAALRNVPQLLFVALNEECVQANVEWLRAYDNGSFIELGPYVNPYDTACFECMLVREISTGDHSVEEELYQRFLEEGRSTDSIYGESIALATQAAAYLSQEAVRIVTAIERPQLDGRVLSFHSDGSIDQNTFTRVPRCDVCARVGVLALPENKNASKIS